MLLAPFGPAACCGERPPCRAIAQLNFPVPARHAYRQDVPSAEGTLGVVGDVQRTSLEGCALGNEVNDLEQRVLLADLAERRPAATLLLGDLVFQGDSSRHWAYFDHLMSQSGLGRTALFALPGNHDYMFYGDLRHMTARFPRLRATTHDALTWGGVRLLMLDANHDRLTPSEWQRQLHFLDCELANVQRGCARGVLLFAHQSPYTQSPWVSGDETLRRDVASRFCASPAKLAFISAHAHGYERWVDVPIPGCLEEHTPFIVSAGGGGPRPPRRRNDAPHDSVHVEKWPAGRGFSDWPRPFNYLLLSQTDRALRIEVYALAPIGGAVVLAETIELPFEASKLAPDGAAPGACSCPR